MTGPNPNRKLELLDAAGRLTQYYDRADVVFTTPAAGHLTAVGQYRGRVLLKNSCAYDTARYCWYRYPILDTGIVRTLEINQKHDVWGLTKT